MNLCSYGRPDCKHYRAVVTDPVRNLLDSLAAEKRTVTEEQASALRRLYIGSISALYRLYIGRASAVLWRIYRGTALGGLGGELSSQRSHRRTHACGVPDKKRW